MDRVLEYEDEDDGLISEPIVTWAELQQEAAEAEADEAEAYDDSFWPA